MHCDVQIQVIIDDRYQTTDPGSSENTKEDKYQKAYMEA
jgi:hypothetical protein